VGDDAARFSRVTTGRRALPPPLASRDSSQFLFQRLSSSIIRIIFISRLTERHKLATIKQQNSRKKSVKTKKTKIKKKLYEKTTNTA